MRLRATSQLYRRHGIADEAGAGEHSWTIPPKSEKVHIPQPDTRNDRVRTSVQIAKVIVVVMGKVMSHWGADFS
jgi:hypothetical protein